MDYSGTTKSDYLESIVSFALSSDCRDYLMTEYLAERCTESDRVEILKRIK